MGSLGRAPVGVPQGPRKRGFSKSPGAHGELNTCSRRNAPLTGKAVEEVEGSVHRKIITVPVVEDMMSRRIVHVFG